MSTNPMDSLPQPLILAPGSFTRKLILKEMGIDFHLLVKLIDTTTFSRGTTDGGQ